MIAPVGDFSAITMSPGQLCGKVNLTSILVIAPAPAGKLTGIVLTTPAKLLSGIVRLMMPELKELVAGTGVGIFVTLSCCTDPLQMVEVAGLTVAISWVTVSVAGVVKSLVVQGPTTMARY
jgi:hypothetical protein